MDDALAREDNVALVKQAFVLILVVMDDALVLLDFIAECEKSKLS